MIEEEKYTAQSKSILAKLLATEDLDVVHENISTAFFDVENRVLHCPILESMSGDLYDLFMGHEVGHALHTPADGWHSSIVESGYDNKFKGFLNVIEDARIEKFIKQKYPGLSKPFSIAYKTLYSRDFFGILEIDSPQTLNLIDRINLHFKCGHFLFIKFSPEEQNFVKEASELSTWEEVVDLSKRIFDYVKLNEKDKINSITDLRSYIDELYCDPADEEGANEQFSFDDSEHEDRRETGETGESSKASSSNSENESDATDEESETERKRSGNAVKDSEEDLLDSDQDQTNNESFWDSDDLDEGEVESVTDKIFRERERDLVIESGLISHVNYSDISIRSQQVDGAELSRQRLSYYFENTGFTENKYNIFIAESRRKFNQKNKAYVNHIAQRFEMKKNAKIYARTLHSKTGVLNMKKISRYKITSDIFLKNEKSEKGKSHGLVMFLDVSASMLNSQKLPNSIEQVLVLSDFCKKVNIPFEVYSFSSSKEVYNLFHSSEDCLVTFSGSPAIITKLLTSNQTNKEYKEVYDMLLSYWSTMTYGYSDGLGCMHPSMGSNKGLTFAATPINTTILSSIKIINNFKKLYSVDITNVIHFTDGEGTDPIRHRDYEYKQIIVSDRETNSTVKVDINRNSYKQQNKMTEFASKVTGCRHIGFFYASKSEIAAMIKSSPEDSIGSAVKIKELIKNGYIQINRQGYSEYYCINTGSKKNTTHLNADKKPSTSNIQKEFLKNQESKYARKIIANKFIEKICQ